MYVDLVDDEDAQLMFEDWHDYSLTGKSAAAKLHLFVDWLKGSDQSLDVKQAGAEGSLESLERRSLGRSDSAGRHTLYQCRYPKRICVRQGLASHLKASVSSNKLSSLGAFAVAFAMLSTCLKQCSHTGSKLNMLVSSSSIGPKLASFGQAGCLLQVLLDNLLAVAEQCANPRLQRA